MASYVELQTLGADRTVRARVRAACVFAACAVQRELLSVPNHANRLIWARKILAAPEQFEGMLGSVLFMCRGMTTMNIMRMTDAEYQAAVDASVDLFADGT